MPSFTTPLDRATETKTPLPRQSGNVGDQPLDGSYTDEEILGLWEVIKHESFDSRWVFERQWQRNLWYVLGRQWIEYQAKYGGWRDKRLAPYVPRPVTNKCKETVQAIRAMFTSINLSVNVRPNGTDPKNVSAAATADDLSPLLHEAHLMNQAMSEFDFWLLVTGNAFLHTYVDYDIKHGVVSINQLQCEDCQATFGEDKLQGAQPVCPECGSMNIAPAVDALTGTATPPKRLPKGVPSTMVLSPLELSFPHTYTRFEDLPYVVRSRWRTKRYYQSHPILKDLVPQITWQRAPMDHSLALYTSLVQTNDLGITPIYWSEGSGRGGQNDEGIAEYEVWMKPTDAYPEGLVFRIIGDAAPLVVHLEDQEGLPGPLPYTDAEGSPLFTFAHGQFEHVGGRILGSGAIDQIVQKQDQLNQLDSLVLLCLQRMANPVWLEPKGAEIQKLTGMPGLVIKWNPLTVGGNAKPERIPGVPIDASVMALREQYLKDIEELSGTYDILKGQKPAGVEAFSAIQALIERSQARFSSVFRSRGDAYKNWFKFAIELERAYGPDERIKQTMTPARTWTYEVFKRAQLQGSFSIVIEDGSTTPKTNLGMRAAVEHANSLGMLNMQDPDQQYEGLKLFGLTRMIPSLDINVQSALQKQQAFEDWIVDKKAVAAFAQQVQQQVVQYQADITAAKQQTDLNLAAAKQNPDLPIPQVQMPPTPPSVLNFTPLRWFPWYSAQIHLTEFLKWANDDHIRQVIQEQPLAIDLLTQHLQEIQSALPKPQAEPQDPKVSFAFSGPDLANPKVAAAFDAAEGAAVAQAPNQPVTAPTGGNGTSGKGGGASEGMKNSNSNSGPAGNKPQKPTGEAKAA